MWVKEKKSISRKERDLAAIDAGNKSWIANRKYKSGTLRIALGNSDSYRKRRNWSIVKRKWNGASQQELKSSTKAGNITINIEEIARKTNDNKNII